jgi:hypothetical protein
MRVVPQIRVDLQMRVFRSIYLHKTRIFKKQNCKIPVFSKTTKTQFIQNNYVYHLFQYIISLEKKKKRKIMEEKHKLPFIGVEIGH